MGRILVAYLGRDSRAPFMQSRAAIFLASVVLALGLPSLAIGDDMVGYDQVKEILRKRCLTCHNPDERRGDLDLKDLPAIKSGSASGAVVVAGDPSASLLYTTVAHLDDPVMPPNSPRLPVREQDIIRRWIEGGLAEKSGSPSATSEMKVAVSANGDKDVAQSKVSTGVVAKPVMASNEANVETDSVVGSRKPSNKFAPVRSLPQLTAIKAMDAHPSKNLIAIAGLRQAVLIEPTSSNFLGALDVDGNVTALRFSRDGKLLLVGTSQPAISGTVIAFDIESGERLWQVGDETDSILGMDLSIDGKTLAVGGPTKTVRLYDVSTGKVTHSLKKHTDWVLDVCYSPDGFLLASGDRFGGIFVWDPKSGAVFQSLKDHVGAVHALVWDHSSETLMSGGEDGILRTWNLHHGELSSRWDAEVGAILALDRSSDVIAVTGRKNALVVWSSPEVCQGRFTLHDQGEVLARTADNRSFVVGDASGQLTILTAKDLALQSTIQLPTEASSIDKLLARVDAEHATYLASKVELDAGKRNATLKKTTVASADAVLADSNQALISDQSLAIQLAATKEVIDQLQKSLQASNQSLASLATLNSDLVKLVKQSSQIQAQLAEQVADQANQLEKLQSRTQELKAAQAHPTHLPAPAQK